MGIASHQAAAMIDLDHVAITASPAGKMHHAARSRQDWRSKRPRYVDPSVERAPASERVKAPAEAGGEAR